MRAAAAVFAAALLFLAGVVVGVGADRSAPPPVASIELVDRERETGDRPDDRETPGDRVEQEVEEHDLEDFDDDSGPGSGDEDDDDGEDREDEGGEREDREDRERDDDGDSSGPGGGDSSGSGGGDDSGSSGPGGGDDDGPDDD